MAITAVLFVHLVPFVFVGGTGAEPGADVAAGMRLAHSHWFTHGLLQGGIGVQLFFAISGCILSLPFALHHLGLQERPISLGGYFLRRLTRLEPPYLLNLALVFGLLVLVKGESAGELLPHLAASAAYVHGLFWETLPRINHVTWSLEVEVQFYVLAPLLASVFRIQDRRWRRAVILGAMVAPPLLLPALGFHRVVPSLLSEIQYFAAGFLLTDLYVVDWDATAPPTRPAWDAIGLAAWLLIIPATAHPLARKLAVPLLTVLAYVAAFRGPSLRRLFSAPWVTALGGMCYTVYLYHWYVLVALGRPSLRLLGTGDPWLDLAIQTALLVPAIFAVSAVLFVLTERPFMRRDWPQRLAARLGGGRPAQDSAARTSASSPR